ncbi:type VI secretion system Vgr family protein [Bradyrhizobium jicamae]|uniref:type VI secretion system Vgr family protein n=1 Tax=Bradyrhizobium jicamae TaxID=280332 RepID=UPI001BACC905|nr:type VI secretion system tip protein TssI/VgrG [Bradyrhizobium jicamae]MBR0936616.1 type VI secretion system tip protein VgrG [Bradyrhizobium jicamae]
MAADLNQSQRVAELKTPLGDNVLALVRFDGTEGLSELFEYHIEALSKQENIDFDKAIGQSCTLKLMAFKGKQRIYDGILTEARWIGKKQDHFHYRLVLRPWLWLLGHKADCRIFLDKNVKEIIQDVFTKAGFSDYEFRTTGDYDKIEYCVQYRETDLTFVSRLMEQFGIYFFFEPSDGKHLLVLADSRSSHKRIPELPKVPFYPLVEKDLHVEQHLNGWTWERRFRTGKIQFNDYDYLQPKKDLQAPKNASEKYTHSKLEVYDYPGKYDEKGKGEKFAQYRLEAEQAFDYRRHPEGDAPCLYPGGLVEVEKHPSQAENKEYLIVRASHMFGAQQYFGGGAEAADNQDQIYCGSFEFLPSERPFRSLPLTPKPRIYGIQTAKVVTKKGDDGEEISTDEHGRIWVKFHWDREPQKTCPIRVAQVWASKEWGGQFIPRVDMEVVVEFLEGDPDRPLVTGCVFNGDNKFPYKLPDNKTQSGVKSDSSKGHSGYNEFMFEDQKGSEFIRMHAEKDHLVTINANQTGTVGLGPDCPMGGDQTWTVGGNRSWTIQKGNDTVELQIGNQTITLDVGQQTVDAMMGINLNVCMGLSSIQITPASISITSPTINLTAMAAVNITAPTVNVGAVLNTPSLIAGAALISGIPI